MTKSTHSRVSRNLVLAACIGGFVWGMTGAVAAQQRVCGERAKLTSFLAKKYQEIPRGLGIGGSGKTVYEVYTSEKGTWTVMMTMTNGITCIMATGHSWKEEDRVAYLPKT